jgi:hypothetical protein
MFVFAVTGIAVTFALATLSDRGAHKAPAEIVEAPAIALSR